MFFLPFWQTNLPPIFQHSGESIVCFANASFRIVECLPDAFNKPLKYL